MKKVFIAVAALATLTLVSCKKDWECSCVTSAAGFTGDPDKTTHKELKKSQAVANCHDMEWTSESGGTTTTYTTDCTLTKK